MESLIQEYITTSLEEDTNSLYAEEEDLLNRRLSPYATIRPGDLASLLGSHTHLIPGLLSKSKQDVVGAVVDNNFTDSQDSAVQCNGGSNNNNGASSSCASDASHWWQQQQQGTASLTSQDNHDDTNDVIDVRCRGSDCNHVPAEYLVSGLRRHEMPVIGVYVDNRICPGFSYRVRRVGSDRFLFGNEPKTLESIGMGYGRRLTFTGNSLNNNDCFFWSDSEPNGYAFTIQVIQASQRLSILDADGVVVGEGVVERADDRQEELSTQVDPVTGKVTKRVRVRALCSLRYHQRHHRGRLMELMQVEDLEAISGEAVISKVNRRSRKASLVAIDNVYLPRIGQCTLVPDA